MAAAAPPVASPQAPKNPSERPWNILENKSLWRHVGVVISAVSVSLLATGNTILLWEWMILPSWNFVLRTAGTMIGVGLGLGLAAHVHDRLEVWHARHEQDKDDSQPVHQSTTRRGSIKMTAGSSAWEEETTYASLMASAGYDVSDRVHRAQVMRRSSSFLKPFYPFTKVPPTEQNGPQIMAQQWPHLPDCVTFELGCFIEHIVRDFVASWYSMLDRGCPYENEKEKRNAQQKRAAQEEEESKEEGAGTNGRITAIVENLPKNVSTLSDRVMVWSTVGHRPLPMLHTMYHSLAIIFGNLSSRVEHVNVFSLILVKWFKVLGHSFKVYRQLRRLALAKTASQLPKRKRKQKKSQKKSLERANSAPALGDETSNPRLTRSRGMTASAVGINAELVRSSPQAERDEDGDMFDMNSVRLEFVEEEEHPPFATNKGELPNSDSKPRKELPHVSEMAMAKEFLLAGKLHRAVTFGLDVPSLLFADTSGKECGVGSDELQEELTEEQVLEKRLFSTSILSECEMDYNRVLANRFCRALLPRSEFSSPIIRTLGTEMIAGSVLSPIMGCFAPDYINDWICKGVDSMSAAKDDSEGASSVDNEELESSDDMEDLDLAGADERDLSMEKGIEMTTKEEDRVVDNVKGTNGTNGGVDRVPNGAEIEDDEVLDQMVDYPGGNGVIEDETGDADVSECSVDAIVEDDDDEIVDSGDGSNVLTSSPKKPAHSTGDDILPLLTMALIELQRHVDFEDCRESRLLHEEVIINWDDPACREAVRQLVLVIEGALLHGCRASRRQTPIKKDKSTPAMNDNGDIAPDDMAEKEYMKSFGSEIDLQEEAVEVSLPQHQSSSLSQTLMELTSDIEAFEDRVAEEENLRENIEESISGAEDVLDQADEMVAHKPSQTEISTLRTLIAAWLHTGQIYHIVSVISRAHTSVLEPFYHTHGFLRNTNNARDFVRQLKSLDGVDILVDTMAVLASSSLDFNKSGNSMNELKGRIQDTWQRDIPASPASDGGTAVATSPVTDGLSTLDAKVEGMQQKPGLTVITKRPMVGGAGESVVSPNDARVHTGELSSLGSAKAAALSQRYFGSSTPRYLDFNRNEAFASSLRLERERRMKSWADVTAVKEGENPGIICRTKGITTRDKVIHREIHHIARVLYAGTNMLSIRNGARRKHSEDSEGQASIDSSTQADNVSLLTVETACQRRRIEVPDDDSSFLLRAQPRPLNPVGVHRDQRNTEHSFKTFYATYEEPALLAGDTRYRGGRYVRRCLLRYFPIDRTASIALPKDYRQLEHRNKGLTNDESGTVEGPSTPFLSSDFLGERHLCKKWYPKGANRSSSILTSSVMEASDFCAVPRTGRALDFVYRMALFENPMVELGGKRFTVHDSTSAGVHRADASSLELSDASLSVALLMAGDDWNDDNVIGEDIEENHSHSSDPNDIQLQRDEANRPKIEMGPDGYPIIWMKFNTKQGDKSNVEVKPCRTSYVRASLLIASTRQNAQLRCLLKCVTAGSARSATKARTDALLWPTLKLLEFSNGPMKEKQSVLLRDLKLGINHIDREQLRRNGLLHPRSPTSILSLNAAIEGALQAKDTGIELHGVTPTTFVFRIRCVAVVDLANFEEDDDVELQYFSEDGSNSGLFREEWIVYRTFREFSLLHKQLKSQVSVSETSVSAGARLVGAATAAFTVHGGSSGSQRPRQPMIPSLGQAKAGALGATRKTIQKRRSVLGSYLKHLTSPTHLLNRCPELLMFLGAFYPLPPEVRTGGGIVKQVRDSLGRAHMARTMLPPLSTNKASEDSKAATTKSVSIQFETPTKDGEPAPLNESTRTERSEQSSVAAGSRSNSEHGVTSSPDKAGSQHEGARQRRRSKKIVMKPSIKAKIDQVTLGEVRFTIFELVRHLFDFDNASFFRSRMFSAMKTMSMAVTTGSEFRKLLYETHIKQLNPEALAGWIRFGLDTLWPEGVFFDSKPAPTPEESKALADSAKEKLPTAFPDQIRTVLGGEITENGFEILHEMLQNRLVLKSMAYMLFDLVWQEIFPEMQDILTCGSALDMK